MIGHQLLELLAAVLAAAIGVVQQCIGFAPPPDRHHQSIRDELRRHRCAHRPTDHAPGEEIDDRGHVEPPLSGPDIGEVGNPFAIGSRCFKAAIEHIGSDGGGVPLTQIRRQATPSGACFESLQPHQSLDPVQTTRQSLRQQVAPHPPGAVGSVARKEAGANLRTQRFIFPAALTARSCQPGIEPTPRDTERPA